MSNTINNIKTIEKTWDNIFSYWKSIESKLYCNGATISDILELRYVGEETPEEWIPLAYWAILDNREATFGQVLFGVVEDDFFKVWTKTYEEWLQIITNEVINHGQVREDTLYQIYNNQNVKKMKYPDYI